MEINLRKARKLEAKIQAYIDLINPVTETTVRSLGNEADRLNTMALARKTFLNQLELRTKLTNARFTIRRLIGQANEATGINALITRREEIQQGLRYAVPTVAFYNAYEVEDEAKARRLRVEKGEAGYNTSTSISVNVATEQDVIGFRQAAAELTRQLEDVEDQLSQKNVGVKITLAADVVSLLKSSDLL